jgi:hypothetical protein
MEISFLSTLTPTVDRYWAEKILLTNLPMRLVLPTPKAPKRHTFFLMMMDPSRLILVGT